MDLIALVFNLSKNFGFFEYPLNSPEIYQINEFLKNSNYFKKWPTWNQWINIKKMKPHYIFLRIRYLFMIKS